MNSLFIQETKKTPLVDFNPETGNLTIKGRSIPENAYDFYIKIIDWVTDYSKTTPLQTKINIDLEYFNSSSLKSIIDILKDFEKIAMDGCRIEVNWYYSIDDEDLFYTGEEISTVINLPFNFIKIKE